MSFTLAAQLEDVSVVEGELTLLEGVSVAVIPGEAVALCGPAGGGKTTVLRALAGLVAPSRGVVRVGGVDLAKLGYEARRALRLRVGLVFESGGFWANRTIFENIALPMLYHRPAGVDIRMAVGDLATELGIEEELSLPGGQAQGALRKLALLARALLFEPPLLLCDEPQRGLLPREARKASAAIERRRRDRGMSVVFADHDGQLRPFVCERRVFLEGGRMVERLSTVISRHDLEDLNIGLPRNSLLGDGPESGP